MKKIMVINDAIWLMLAVSYMIAENPSAWMEALVWITTGVYAVDLFLKLKDTGFAWRKFFKDYWLDVLFLVPFVKIFRGVRMFKAGRTVMRAMQLADSACDMSEIAFRVWSFIKKTVFCQANSKNIKDIIQT